MGLKILIVEDEEITAMLYREILLKEGYTVTGCVQSGEEAVQQVKKDNPDLIIMDIFLSGAMNGIDAVREIKKFRKIPVIYVTANSDDMTRKSAMETCPAGYLTKPIQMRELSSLIKVSFVSNNTQDVVN